MGLLMFEGGDRSLSSQAVQEFSHFSVQPLTLRAVCPWLHARMVARRDPDPRSVCVTVCPCEPASLRRRPSVTPSRRLGTSLCLPARSRGVPSSRRVAGSRRGELSGSRRGELSESRRAELSESRRAELSESRRRELSESRKELRDAGRAAVRCLGEFHLRLARLLLDAQQLLLGLVHNLADLVAHLLARLMLLFV